MVENMTDHVELFEKLRNLSVRPADYEINLATEIYYDLRVSGDDFDELIEWVSTKFSTDFSAMKARYVPGEAEIFPLVFRLFGQRPYKSITVGDLLNAIERNRW